MGKAIVPFLNKKIIEKVSESEVEGGVVSEELTFIYENISDATRSKFNKELENADFTEEWFEQNMTTDDTIMLDEAIKLSMMGIISDLIHNGDD